jgi:hypothetical protein
MAASPRRVVGVMTLWCLQAGMGAAKGVQPSRKNKPSSSLSPSVAAGSPCQARCQASRNQPVRLAVPPACASAPCVEPVSMDLESDELPACRVFLSHTEAGGLKAISTTVRYQRHPWPCRCWVPGFRRDPPCFHPARKSHRCWKERTYHILGAWRWMRHEPGLGSGLHIFRGICLILPCDYYVSSPWTSIYNTLQGMQTTPSISRPCIVQKLHFSGSYTGDVCRLIKAPRQSIQTTTLRCTPGATAHYSTKIVLCNVHAVIELSLVTFVTLQRPPRTTRGSM